MILPVGTTANTDNTDRVAVDTNGDAEVADPNWQEACKLVGAELVGGLNAIAALESTRAASCTLGVGVCGVRDGKGSENEGGESGKAEHLDLEE